MYDELVKRLKEDKSWVEQGTTQTEHEIAEHIQQAADAIEELMKAAKAMHTWIFLHAGDEQKAYDECGLSDEMNTALGYCGQFVAEPPKEE